VSSYDVIIIGAGAAGLMCASQAGKRGRKTLIIDHAKKPGEKIRISGGGRCNFTNLYTNPNNFISQNPHFCISALKRFSQHDFIKLVEKYKIPYHEKTLGQLFCDNSSKDIVNMLLDECNHNVTLHLNSNITNISKEEPVFHLQTNTQELPTNVNGLIGGSKSNNPADINLLTKNKITTESLVIATGGLSIPKMGATSFGYDAAKQFGINMIETDAALVPFIFNDNLLKNTKNLAGISVEAEVKCNKAKFREAILFTHRGISGPAILQISSYWKKGDIVNINFLPSHNIKETLLNKKLYSPKQEVHNSLSEYLPKKLAKYLCEISNCNINLSDLSNKSLNFLSENIHNFKLTPSETEGYRTAEVTIGGIDTNELSSKTFETKSVKGLYFIGEVIDVTGHLGGFNFQWAWSSGHAAGQFV